MSDLVPARDRSGVYYPTARMETTSQDAPDAGTRAQATLWLVTRGHRDIAQMLGLLPTLDQVRADRSGDGADLPEVQP